MSAAILRAADKANVPLPELTYLYFTGLPARKWQPILDQYAEAWRSSHTGNSEAHFKESRNRMGNPQAAPVGKWYYEVLRRAPLPWFFDGDDVAQAIDTARQLHDREFFRRLGRRLGEAEPEEITLSKEDRFLTDNWVSLPVRVRNFALTKEPRPIIRALPGLCWFSREAIASIYNHATDSRGTLDTNRIDRLKLKAPKTKLGFIAPIQTRVRPGWVSLEFRIYPHDAVRRAGVSYNFHLS